MAKITGGLLSLDARGSIADTLTFSKSRGVPYARQRVIPSNPQTTAQTSTRTAFKTSSDIWKNAGSLLRAPWTRYAQGQKSPDRSSFIGLNTSALRGQSDMATFIGSPGAKGGLAPLTVSAAAGSLEADVTFTTPTPPTGWTLDSVIAVAILNQDPEAPTDLATFAAENDTTMDVVTITGLTASVEYLIAGWTRWLKPDDTLAYGPSLNDTVTPTS